MLKPSGITNAFQTLFNAPAGWEDRTLNATPLALHHAPLLHKLYNSVPGYFALLGNQAPNFSEVQRDLEIALHDPRRRLELLHDEQGELIGSLDYKMNYPAPGDLTINLLLIREERQSQGLGEQAVRHLETHLPAGTTRVLASVLGNNPRGAKFWQRLGYEFTLDARPVMTWYAKTMNMPPTRPNPTPLQAAGD